MRAGSAPPCIRCAFICYIMRCENPLKIKNPYNGKNITVPCRHCDSCKIASANAKSLLLMNELNKASAAIFITLTYDNEHLPVVFYGSDYICRKSGNYEPEEMLPYEQFFEPVKPINYPLDDCTGVLYYRDFQLFVKRLRINLSRNGKGNFKYFVVGEYGTVHKRPHWHAILFFESFKELRGIEEFILKSWRMCDPGRTREGIKCADTRIASYLAGYVTCNNNSYELAQHELFRQKTRRSASLDYGTAAKDKETLREVIASGLFEQSYVGDLRPFEYIDSSRKDTFSVGIISERCFRTYFRKPFNYGTLSFNAFCIRARIIFKLNYGSLGCRELNQMDLNFIRGYRAFLKLMNYDNSYGLFCYYVDLFWRLDCLYKSVQLRRYMLSYETKSSEEYFLDAYDTEARDFGSKVFWTDIIKEFAVTRFDTMSNQSRHELLEYRFKYQSRLLPKHLNSMYYDFV